MDARFQAQQAGQWLGYQQAVDDIRSLGIGPIIGPAMGSIMGPAICSQFLSPISGFNSPYAVPHGDFGSFDAMGNPGWAAQSWGNQDPSQFGQGQVGFPVLPMGQVVAAPDQGTSHGAPVRHSARGAIRGSRGGRTQSGRSGEKDSVGYFGRPCRPRAPQASGGALPTRAYICWCDQCTAREDNELYGQDHFSRNLKSFTERSKRLWATRTSSRRRALPEV